MKKMIVIIIALSMMISMIGITANASSQKLLLHEAKEIIWEAYLFANQVRFCVEGDYTQYLDQQYYDILPDGRKQPITYYQVLNLPGGSYEAMKECAGRIYSKDIVKYSYTYAIGRFGLFPLFVIGEDGTVYGGIDHEIQYRIPAHELSLNGISDPFKATTFPLCTKSTDKYNADRLIVKMVESTESTATAKVALYHEYDYWNECYDDWELIGEIIWADCNFVKEDGVWKISGGEFFDNFNGTYREPSPSTSDSAVGYFVLLPVLALACLVPLPLARKKRHRA